VRHGSAAALSLDMFRTLRPAWARDRKNAALRLPRDRRRRPATPTVSDDDASIRNRKLRCAASERPGLFVENNARRSDTSKNLRRSKFEHLPTDRSMIDSGRVKKIVDISSSASSI